jgi:hypothetical protein
MNNETKLKLIISNAKLLLANQYNNVSEAHDILYEMKDEIENIIENMRTDR